MLALLGGLNLAVGIVLLAVGAAYDFLGRSPGTMAIIGASAMAGPWLALAQYMKTRIAAEKVAIDAAHRESMRKSLASNTGVHRALQAMIDEHGEEHVSEAVSVALVRRADK